MRKTGIKKTMTALISVLMLLNGTPSAVFAEETAENAEQMEILNEETEETVPVQDEIREELPDEEAETEETESTDSEQPGSEMPDDPEKNDLPVTETAEPAEKPEEPENTEAPENSWFQDLLAAEAEKSAGENGEYDLSDGDTFSDAVISRKLRLFSSGSRTSAEVKPSMNGLEYVGVYTGTAPFDTGNNPWSENRDAGLDFAQKDNVVRSFDEVVYRVGYAAKTDELSTQVTSGSFYFKAELPYDRTVGEWDLDAMAWLLDLEITENDGKQTLTGHVDFSGGVIAPRIGILNLAVLVHCHINGTELPAPVFSMGLEEDFSDCLTAEGNDTVIVSAAPSLDAGIKFLGKDSEEKPYWGVYLTLRAPVAGRGIRGQGLLNPDDTVRVRVAVTSGSYVDIKSNNKEQSGNEGIIPQSYFTTALPFDYGSTKYGSDYDTVYHGGAVSASENGINQVSVTLSGTEYGDLLEESITHNANGDRDSGQVYNDDIYPIAAVILQTAKPSGSIRINEAEILEVSHTLANGIVLSDRIDSNNKASYTLETPSSVVEGDYAYGPMGVISAANITSGRGIDPTDAAQYANGYITVRSGDEVSIQSNIWNESAWEADHGGIRTLTGFIKFNADMFEPVSGKNNLQYAFIDLSRGTEENKDDYEVGRYTRVYFVAKEDGSNWSDEAEMADAHIDGASYSSDTLLNADQINSGGSFRLYSSADEVIASGKKAVGFYVIIDDVYDNLYNDLGFLLSEYAVSANLGLPVLKVRDTFQMNGSGELKPLNDPARASAAMQDVTAVGCDGKVNRNFSQSSWVNMNYSESGAGAASSADNDTAFSYRRPVFNNAGELSGFAASSNHWYNFDRTNWLQGNPMTGGVAFYMLTGSAYLNFGIADKADSTSSGTPEPKRVWNLDKNERTVNLTAQLGTNAGGAYPHETENFTLKFSLPEGVYPEGTGTVQNQYNVTFGDEKVSDPAETALWSAMTGNSAWLSEAPSYQVAFDASTRHLIVTFMGIPMGYALPDVHFQVHLGTENNTQTDLYNNETLEFNAELDTDRIGTVFFAKDGMSVVRLGSASVVKTAMNEERTMEEPGIGFDIEYTDARLQLSAPDVPVVMLDILPYNDSALGTEALNPGLNLGNYILKNVQVTGTVTKDTSNGTAPSLDIWYSTAAPADIAANISSQEDAADPYNIRSSGYWTKITLNAAENSDPLTDISREIKISEMNGKKITAIAFSVVNAGAGSKIKLHYEYDWNGLNTEERAKIELSEVIRNRVLIKGGSEILAETYSEAVTKPKPGSVYVFYYEDRTDVPLWQPVSSYGNVGESFSIASPEIEGYTIVSTSPVTVTGTRTEKPQYFKVYYDKDPMRAQQVQVIKTASPANGQRVRAGDTITYTLTARNTGVSASGVIHIEDDIPEGTTYVAGSATDSGNFNNGKVIWDLSGLANRASRAVSFRVRVNDSFDSLVYNRAYYRIGAESGFRETNEVIHPANTETELQGPAALQLIKNGEATVTSTTYTDHSASRSWNATGSVQTWTAPETGTYTFTVYGAQGGAGDAAGVLGAKTVSAPLKITKGTSISIYVGRQGGSSKFVSRTGDTGGSGGSHSYQNRTADSLLDNSKGQIASGIYVEKITLSGRSDGGSRTVYGWIGTSAQLYNVSEDANDNYRFPSASSWSGNFNISGDGATHSQTFTITPSNTLAGLYTRCVTSGNSSAKYHNCHISVTGWKTARSGGTGAGGWGRASGGTSAYSGGGGGSSAVVFGNTTVSAAGGAGGALNPAWGSAGAGGGTNSGGTSTNAQRTGNGYVEVSYTWTTSSTTTSTSTSTIASDADNRSVIRYSMTLTNNGNTAAKGVIVHDPIPAGTAYKGGITEGGTYNANAKRVEWYFDSIPAHSSKTLAFEVNVDQPPTQYLIANQAYFGRDYTAAQKSTAADLKHASNIYEMLIPGRITVKKNWMGDERNTSTRPSSITVNLQGSNGTNKTAVLTAANQWQAVFDVEYLTPAQTAVTYTVWEASVPAGYRSSATAASKAAVPSTGNVTITNTYLTRSITVNKVWDDDGDTSSRPASITVYCAGDGKTYTGTLSAPNWSYTFRNLPVLNASGNNITYQVYEADVENYESSADSSHRISIAGGEGDSAVTIRNELVRDFPIIKTVTDADGTDINEMTVSPGAELYYHIRFQNPFSTERRFRIIDAVPANTVFVSAQNNGTNQNGNVIWSDVRVAPGQWGEVTFIVKTNTPGAKIVNQAEGTVFKTDGESEVMTKETNKVVNYTPQITKAVYNAKGTDINGQSVEPGQVIHYEITVGNTAESARQFTITDHLPDGLSYIRASDGGTLENGTVKWTANIPAGSEKTVTVFARVQDGVRVHTNAASLKVDLAEAESNEVSTWTAIIRINKHINNYCSEYGIPSFNFSITDADEKVWYRNITIDGPETEKDGSAVFYVPDGISGTSGMVYRIRELKNARYDFVKAEGVKNIEIDEGTGTALIKKGFQESEISYSDEIRKWNKVSHADVVINKAEQHKTD